MKTPEQILADAREEAAILRRNGHTAQAVSVERVCEAFSSSPLVADLLTWMSEQSALERSAKSADYFRDRRVQWEIDGYAKREGRKWFYRRCVVPRSRLSSIQRTEAARGERVG